MANLTVQVTVPVEEPKMCQKKPSIKFIFSESIITAFSLLIYLIDIVTDIILGTQYINSGYYEWGVITIVLCVVPLIVCQLISLRWHQADSTKITLPVLLLHCSLLGIVHRYALILKLGFKSYQTKESLPYLHHHQSDICLLRLFESFLESAPQLLLQLYVMHELGEWHFWTVICAIGSLVSLAWGIASYARTMRMVREDKAMITWIGFALQAVWRTGTMVSRIMALLLCASVLHNWFLLAISIHWFFMTCWTVRQKTDLCSTAWEERVYNSLVGVIYCFCFFNLKEGPSRHRATIFYTVTATENAACLAVFLQFAPEHLHDQWLHTTGPVLIVIGALTGHTSQLIYYRWFHPSGPISAFSSRPVNNYVPDPLPESGAGPTVIASPVAPVRTLKYINPMSRKFSGVSLASALPEPLAEANINIENPPRNNNASPKIPERVSAPIPMKNKSNSDSSLLDPAAPKQNLSVAKSKSVGHLVVMKEFTTNTQRVSTEDSESVASSASFHDYENMAVLNVNRTDWGLRHWKSYSDIETSFHDNSICRERDILECSTTSASSTDSSRIIATGVKLGVQEAISQLKSLAALGHNIYQPDNSLDSSNNMYECVWTDEGGSNCLPVKRICPTSGHNLSAITELSENSISSTSSSTRSKSSLAYTVDTIMEKSPPAAQERLTYVEVNFLSKLDRVPDAMIDPRDYNFKRTTARRQFSIIREQFGPPIKQGKRGTLKRVECDKENAHFTLEKVKSPAKRQSTLSPRALVFAKNDSMPLQEK